MVNTPAMSSTNSKKEGYEDSLWDAPRAPFLPNIVVGVWTSFLPTPWPVIAQKINRSMFYFFQTSVLAIHRPEGMEGLISLCGNRTKNCWFGVHGITGSFFRLHHWASQSNLKIVLTILELIHRADDIVGLDAIWTIFQCFRLHATVCFSSDCTIRVLT